MNLDDILGVSLLCALVIVPSREDVLTISMVLMTLSMTLQMEDAVDLRDSGLVGGSGGGMDVATMLLFLPPFCTFIRQC